MQIHGPSFISHEPADIRVDLNTHAPDRAFATVSFPNGLDFFLYDEKEADTLIKVFCQAKDMLHAHKQAAAMAEQEASGLIGGFPTVADRGRYDAASAAEVAEGVAPVEGRVMDEAAVDGMRIKAVLGFGPDPGSPATGPCGAWNPAGDVTCSLSQGHAASHVAAGEGWLTMVWPAAGGLPVLDDEPGDGDDDGPGYVENITAVIADAHLKADVNPVVLDADAYDAEQLARHLQHGGDR